MSQGKWLRPRVSREEYLTLQRLRERQPARNPPKSKLTLGDRVSDAVAETVGSWRFIIIQSVLLFLWIVLNVTGIGKWDPYPFILLNLMLSFQAAYTAPIIMMSQNRQAGMDRDRAEHDYQVNVKSELEVELLHDKMNLLREVEIIEIVQMMKQQKQQLERLEVLLQQKLDSSKETENSLNSSPSND
ncbi:hypothetical protein BZZ01_11965 [Nostocales cyanobacterium HT-58-2]|nr:hypothetical protein BZZ01_11965 [Nostocales cyanobacterium HT-58-2]